MSMLKITNVKISFLHGDKICLKPNHEEILEYFSKNIHVIKFSKYTATLMKYDTYCNITGIKSCYELINSLKILSSLTNVEEKYIEYKIDTISAVMNVRPGLKAKLILHGAKFGFTVESKMRFCGLILRHPKFEKCSLTYFQTGKMNVLGIKKFDLICEYSKFVNSFIDSVYKL